MEQLRYLPVKKRHSESGDVQARCLRAEGHAVDIWPPPPFHRHTLAIATRLRKSAWDSQMQISAGSNASDSSLSNHSLWFPLSSPLHNPSLSRKLRLCSSGCLCGPRWATGNTRTGGHSKHSHHHPMPRRWSSRLVLCWLIQLRCWDREKTVQRTSKVRRRQVSRSHHHPKESKILLSWKLGQKGTGLQEHLETSLR